VNPRCFGEDFVHWLRNALDPLQAEGFIFSAPIQEDWGWGFRARRGRDPFWVALGISDEQPGDGTGEWFVFAEHDRMGSPLRRLFRRRDDQALSRLRSAITNVLGATPGIRILGPA
jgi:hypothetical protein